MLSGRIYERGGISCLWYKNKDTVVREQVVGEVQGRAKKPAIRLDYSGAASPDAVRIKRQQEQIQFNHGQAPLTAGIFI